MDIKKELIRNLKREQESLSKIDVEKSKACKELAKTYEKMDLTFLESQNIPSTSRRRNSREGSESNLEEHLEEQIEHVKKALNIIYDEQASELKKFLKDNGKRKGIISSRIPFLKRIRENGHAIPLWINSGDEEIPYLCGAIGAEENHVSEVGDLVAAYINQEGGCCWMLAEVVAYDPTKKEYVVDDIFENRRSRQTLSWKKIIPLPTRRADPKYNPEALFQEGSHVLALYPGTTCFYRAYICKVPAKPADSYVVRFENKKKNGIAVPQRYVLNFKHMEGETGNVE